MKNTRTAWIVYTVLRLLFFAVPFAALFAIGVKPWLAAIFAALIGVSLSIIFLAKPRSVASESIYEWRTRERTPDSIVEDEAADAAESEASTEAPGTTEAPASADSPAADASSESEQHPRETA